jgi:hypothetical protein
MDALLRLLRLEVSWELYGFPPDWHLRPRFTFPEPSLTIPRHDTDDSCNRGWRFKAVMEPSNYMLPIFSFSACIWLCNVIVRLFLRSCVFYLDSHNPSVTTMLLQR